mmetsp:Transcript_15683/g.31210  ORF Transcript_15683/g.31210 Transcript_15683/m.31210 type:complete len:288 (+) Transcript_15683:173-1036(+)
MMTTMITTITRLALGLCLILHQSAALTTHVLTGSAGYICKETIHHILESRPSDLVVGLCRSNRVQSEAEYWRKFSEDRVSIQDINEANYPDKFTLYLIASNFSPGSEKAKAIENVESVLSAISSVSPRSCQGVVLLSSMAAVRGPGQAPGPAGVFTSEDWNSVSELREGDFAQSYQYSKTAQEKAFASACDAAGLSRCSICPSLVLGPLRSPTQYGTSLRMIQSWYTGEKVCESRLLVDVRDVATALIKAGDEVRRGGARSRYIVSNARRRSGSEIVSVLNSLGRRS